MIQGRPDDVGALKADRDVVLIEWSAKELPALDHAPSASLIFLVAIGLAALGILPVVVAALAGAVAMVAMGVLNVRQASRAVEPNIVTTIVAALALGVSLQETGGAAYLARAFSEAMGGAAPAVVLSFFFLLVAGLSNVISTKTCAVLFTPIAVDLAQALGVAPEPFASRWPWCSPPTALSPLPSATRPTFWSWARVITGSPISAAPACR